MLISPIIVRVPSWFHELHWQELIVYPAFIRKSTNTLDNTSLILLTDITYIPFDGRFCYLSTILDAFTKQILSYVLSESLEVDFVLETVNLMVEKHQVSLTTETIIHSDQGCHYTSCSFIQLVKDKGLRQSMSRRGNCWDNTLQESFFGRMKDHIGYKLKDCIMYCEVLAIIDDWMDYYNNDRYQ